MPRLDRRSLLAATGALTALPARAQEADGAIWTPMSLTHGMVLSARVNGHAWPVVLDSGASGDGLMDLKTANRLRLKLDGSFPVGGWVTSAQAQQAEPIHVRLGGETLTLQMAVVDFKSGAEPPIILGRNVFAGRLLDFDFPNSRLAVRPRDGDFKPPGALVPMTLDKDGAKLMPIRVEGHTITTLMDFGDSGGLSLSAKLADKMGLTKGRRVSSGVSRALDGAYSYRITSLRKVELGGTDLTGLPVAILDTWVHQADAILGLEGFGRFHMVCDFDANRVWMQPNPVALAKPFDKDLGGLDMMPDGGRLRVFHVAANSPAAAAGWKVGDVVTAVDIPGPLNGMTRLRGPVGRVVTLTMADGSSRQVTLSEYY
jgi:hypothetical protein